jgi:hypothetical protein
MSYDELSVNIINPEIINTVYTTEKLLISNDTETSEV